MMAEGIVEISGRVWEIGMRSASKQRQHAIGILFFTAFACWGLGTQIASARPNVLFLFADDQRPDSIAALGNAVVQTPNLDRLVNRGFVFRNTYCMGSMVGAVCNPSRHMTLSGKALFHYDGSEPRGTFGDVMRKSGFVTWHLSKRGNTARAYHTAFEYSSYLNDFKERESGHHGKTGADRAIQFLTEKWTKDQPFFMYLGFTGPHDPRVAAKQWLDLYKRQEIPLPANYQPIHPFDNGEMVVRDERLAAWPRTEEAVREHLHDYYGCISSIDHHVGRIMQTLTRLGELENTIVVYSADHGLAVGSHGLFGKQNLYEHSMKAPLIIAGPGIKPGGSEALAYLYDIFPTVVDLVDREIPAGLDGKSLAPIVRGEQTQVRERELLAQLGNLQTRFHDPVGLLVAGPSRAAVDDDFFARSVAAANQAAQRRARKQRFPGEAGRVLFLGDSITHAGGYISLIESTLRSQRGARSPTLINLGLPSETCSGLSEPIHPFPRPNVHERLARALRDVKPDLVVACYGMNDGIYYPFSTDRFQAFQEGIDRLIKEVKASGAKLILLTPPPFDPTPLRAKGALKPAGAAEYSWLEVYEKYDKEVLARYAKWVMDQRTRVDLVIDLRTPVLKYVALRRKTRPTFALSDDGVHLNAEGHRILATTILRRWGHREMWEPDAELLRIVTEKSTLLHNSWLSHVGHKRPGMKAGLPLEEARQKAASLDSQIAELVGGQAE
jgi:arylsulfatase A-like enzyme